VAVNADVSYDQLQMLAALIILSSDNEPTIQVMMMMIRKVMFARSYTARNSHERASDTL